MKEVAKKVKISLIVAIYNIEDKLSRCLDSIAYQTMNPDDIEVILVDDGSTDSSGKICDTYASKYDIFRVIHRENGGAAAARNSGLEEAKGQWIAFIDGDDYLEADYCEKAYSFGKESDAEIVMFDAFREEMTGNKRMTVWGHDPNGFYTNRKDDIGSLCCKILYPYYRAKVENVGTLKNDVPLAAPWDKVYKADFLRENNLKFTKELKVLDDMFFNFQAFSAARSVAYYPVPLYHYLIWNGSITNRYDSRRPKLDQDTFDYLQKEIFQSVLDNNEKARIEQAFYARVIKSFAICCRLYFFNDNNPNSHSDRLREVKRYMNKDVYDIAFKEIEFKVIEWKLWFVTIAGRLKSPGLLYILHLLQNRNKK